MESCRHIVNLALRKLGVLGAGREPRASDTNDGFQALKDLYMTMISAGTFGRLRDVVPLADYVAGENERIFRDSNNTFQVTLPLLVPREARDPRPYDQENQIYSAQLTEQNSRTPRDCAVVVICDGFTGMTNGFIYDGHVKQWQSLYDIAIDDAAPLSHRDAQGLAALLATTVADIFGTGTLSPTTIQAAKIFQSSMVNRWSSPANAIPGSFM